MDDLGSPDETVASDQPVGLPRSIDPGIPGLVDFSEIGRGGFGVVFRATDVALHRTVAVKVMSAALDRGARERFAREGMVLGAVSGHPNIVQVLMVGETTSGSPYLMMPFIEGGTLLDLSPLPWQEAVSAAIRLCGALETAHRAGVLHRDVKPANVLWSQFGEPLLADFGLSRLGGRYETTDGAVRATVAFAPPEVLGGAPPSVASDIYSLAATVHFLIRGRAPFSGIDDEALFAHVVRIEREVVPDLRVLGVPDPVCAAIEVAMSKDPAGRPVSAFDFGELLQQAQRAAGITATVIPVADAVPRAGGPIDVDPAPDGERAGRAKLSGARSLLVFLAAVAAVAIGLGAAKFWPSSTPSVGPAGVMYPTAIAIEPDGHALIVDGDRHQVLRLARDGSVDVAIGTGALGNSGDGQRAVNATLENPSAVAIAPDGTIFVASGGAIRLVDASGIIRAVDAFEGYLMVHGLAFSGTDLYVAQESNISVMSADGVARPMGFAGANPFRFIEDIVAHPDGGIAVTDSGSNRVYHLTDDGDVTVLMGADSDFGGDGRPARETSLSQPSGVAFDTAGRLLVSETGLNRIRRVESDGTVLTIAGDAENYSIGFSGDGGPATAALFDLGIGPLAADADGTLLVGDVRNQRIRRVGADGIVRTVG